MAYRAPFATMEVELPPWYTERAAWSTEDKNGRIQSDIMLNGAGYHGGYMNYNGAYETPKRLATRLAQQKSGLTGSIVWKKDDLQGTLSCSGEGSRLPTPLGSKASQAMTVPGSHRSQRTTSHKESVSRPKTSAASSNRKASVRSRLPAAVAEAASAELARCSTAPALVGTLASPLSMTLTPTGESVWKDSYANVFRDRDRRHKDWNQQATFTQNLDGTLTRPENFAKAGPAHPFAALWDGPATSWKRHAKGLTLSPMTMQTMVIPGI
eukprot:TRINITY_DN107698_c0_g1_i1.p1 TRINITY_DN107698_c0_g1~~TRINITY_DN107698_c0_g1_i1.p1  ORF type:complete len:281 (-),score=40.77 TRINITY_DN107698_c0_g1_i1:77-880(-)